jgi:hypothetical protein
LFKYKNGRVQKCADTEFPIPSSHCWLLSGAEILKTNNAMKERGEKEEEFHLLYYHAALLCRLQQNTGSTKEAVRRENGMNE